MRLSYKMTEEKIHTLLVKYLTKEASTAEEEELLAWLTQSEDHRNMFRSLKDAFDLGQFEKHIANSDTATEWKKLLRRIRPAKKPIRTISPFRIIMRYAAVFVLGLMCMKAADLLFSKKDVAHLSEMITKIETGKGERSKVTLPDSTIVWLNACSSISYEHNFGNTTRKVNMKGELFFDVRKDTAKPFLVCTDSLNYLVTGTSFNVYSFDNENIESMVLVEGAVTLNYGNRSMEINAGELIEFDKSACEIRRQQINTDLYAHWRFGELMFNNMTFEELAKRLERNFNVTFVFENEKVKKESFGGSFRNYDSLETIMKVISTSTPVKFKIEKDIVYVR